MSLTLTLLILVIAAVIFGGATYMSRRPSEPGNVPLVPYGGIQFVALVAIVLMLAHLVSLSTGQPFKGRFGV